jgi:hypothetical protein
MVKSVILPNITHTLFTTQGIAILNNHLYALTSEAQNNQYTQGMCIDDYNLITLNVDSTIYDKEIFQEPEGATVIDGHLYTTLVNQAGLYKII